MTSTAVVVLVEAILQLVNTAFAAIARAMGADLAEVKAELAKRLLVDDSASKTALDRGVDMLGGDNGDQG